jgi:hypothetical protein
MMAHVMTITGSGAIDGGADWWWQNEAVRESFSG